VEFVWKAATENGPRARRPTLLLHHEQLFFLAGNLQITHSNQGTQSLKGVPGVHTADRLCGGARDGHGQAEADGRRGIHIAADGGMQLGRELVEDDALRNRRLRQA
jgi:hypothetical protein